MPIREQLEIKVAQLEAQILILQTDKLPLKQDITKLVEEIETCKREKLEEHTYLWSKLHMKDLRYAMLK